MANSRGSSNMRNLMLSGKHSLLPPKSPFPSISSAFVDYAGPPIGSKAVGKPKEVSPHHQRTSSESLLIEEQPSWLDDLLNEPETPVRKGGHRRSSSDSFAYLDIANLANIEPGAQKEQKLKNVFPVPSWGPPDRDHHEDGRHAPLIAETNSAKLKNGAWESSLGVINHPSSVASVKDNVAMQNSGPSCSLQEFDGSLSACSQKQDPPEASSNNAKSSDKRDGCQGKSSASETDTKRAKQQFAQRSRVRKLQYIAELERNVQALQAEGSEVSAELDFLNQQNLILSMENKALQQRLESLAQEQMIKYLEHEVLEREIGRLRALYQQQQQPLQPPQHQQKQSSSGHRRNNSKDLDSQFANLSLRHKDANSGHENVSGSLRI